VARPLILVPRARAFQCTTLECGPKLPSEVGWCWAVQSHWRGLAKVPDCRACLFWKRNGFSVVPLDRRVRQSTIRGHGLQAPDQRREARGEGGGEPERDRSYCRDRDARRCSHGANTLGLMPGFDFHLVRGAPAGGFATEAPCLEGRATCAISSGLLHRSSQLFSAFVWATFAHTAAWRR
jgi:hypothetical protein